MIDNNQGHRARRRALSRALILVAATASIGGATRLDEPPRYDGAGYAMLGLGLASGAGYRDVGHPDAPAHSHFPPGYPAALGLLWKLRGRADVASAHLLSVACTLVAIGATCRWWRSTEPPAASALLGLALAVNWSWGRVGGSIQSEPPYLALGGLTLLLAGRAARRGGILDGGALGVALGACLLTRHVGACLALAVAVDLWLRGRRASVASAAVVAATLCAPWIAWQARAGSATQAGLFRREGLPALIAHQALFYAGRIPDVVTGPLVEAATVFGRSPRFSGLATGWAFAASALVAFGWAGMLRSPRRRLGALIPLANLALLMIWPFTEAGRFLVPLVPFVLMGAVEGLAMALRALGARRPRRWAAGMLLVASLPYSAYASMADRAGAQRRTHERFDAACRWIAAEGGRPGPVLASHPADVAWLAGRPALATPAEGVGAIAGAIARHRVTYLLVDRDRYADAPANPLRAYVAEFPKRVRLAWGDRGGIAVYEVVEGEGGGEDPP